MAEMKDDKPRLQWEEWIAIASLALLVLITLGNVLVRYLTDESFAWTEEISVFLMVVLTLAGASAIAQRDRHIRIEFFLHRRTGSEAQPQQRRGLWQFGVLATSFVFMLLAALLGRWVWDQFHFNETSMGLGWPLWWYGIVLVPLCLAIAVRAFSAFLRLRRALPGEEGRT
jgi:TRAP-type C4-dicarboxylate transport system permease small subunit